MGKWDHACNQIAKSPEHKAPLEDRTTEQSLPESTFSQYHQIPVHLLSHLSSKDEEFFWFKNRALNASLSYTLKHFVTKVRIRPAKESDFWSPFKGNEFQNTPLYRSSRPLRLDQEISPPEQKKFLDFFKYLKRFFLIPGHYEISSQNNFPKAAGLASSASSFSALSLATYRLAQDRSQLPKEKQALVKTTELAQLSRIGSGSSCRSLYEPWCIWDKYKVYSFDCVWDPLEHQLILIDSQKKAVSSSLAHHKVKSSPWFTKRIQNMPQRITAIKTAFNLQDWRECFEITRKEFLELHKMFESSKPAFSYQTPASRQVLEDIDNLWSQYKDGPLVTMDAGPNIHLLYRRDQRELKEALTKKLSDYVILSSL